VKLGDNILRCPRCGGRDVRRSTHRKPWDALMLVLRRVPQRCRGCQNRFYIYSAPGASEHLAPADHGTPADQTSPASQTEIR
jgi:hypothetical protein